MWNINLRLGTIWRVKSLNEYEESYLGMSFGSSNVMIISAFIDDTNIPKFTYLKAATHKTEYHKYIDVNVAGTEFYIQFDEMLTGDQRALERFIGNIDKDAVNCILSSAKQYFNLKPIKSKISKLDSKLDETNCQQRIKKFGIDIYVKETEHVHISDDKKLILSDQAKYDIMRNSKTDEDIKLLCEKYHIYPMKAIRELRNRLVYQYKQRDKRV